jgi:phospholipase C
MMDRREFLQRSAVVGSGLLLEQRLRKLVGAGSSDLVQHEAAHAAAPSSLKDIEHVVFLIQENRSYDHYFGAYPKGRGFDDHPQGSPGLFAQPDPPPFGRTKGGLLYPWHLDTLHANASCFFDVGHEWTAQHVSWNNGQMNGWMRGHRPTPGAEKVMGYYTRADLPFYYGLADAFTLCDHYHCSVFGPTDPNRHYAMSATCDPEGNAGGPVVTNPSDAFAPKGQQIALNAALYTWTTMPERLEAAGVSWKVYQVPGSLRSTPTTNNILLRYRQYGDPKSPLYQQAFVPRYPHDFEQDVKSGMLPAVSWLNARTPGQDEHPPYAPNVGEHVTGHVLRTLLANPKVWAKTVLFVTYDENGGFFDHVTPPTPPPGTPGEYVPPAVLPALANGINGPIGLSFRVPMLVISPFSRGGHINSDTYDHTSMLRFLETRFGVEVPNVSAWRRATVSDLTSTLQFTKPRVDVPKLPYQALPDQLVQRECKDYIGHPAQPPTKQRLPKQGA